jgi:hypothetical protein
MESTPKNEVNEVAYNRKEKVRNFIELEKLNLVEKAVESGLSKNDVLEFLTEENLADFNLKNLRARMTQPLKQ